MSTHRDNLAAAHDGGSRHGSNAASWIDLDEHSAAIILQGWEDGDPETMDLQPAPLSGEWAGQSIAEVSADLDVWADDLHNPELADAYEQAFGDAFWNTLLGRCRYYVD